MSYGVRPAPETSVPSPDGRYTPAEQAGNIIIKAGILPGEMPEAHEWKTLNRLAAFGLDVLFVVHPDVVWNGLEWDMKHPYGGGKNNIDNTFKRGHDQSRRLIIDLSRSPFADAVWTDAAMKRISTTTHYDEFLLILKDGSGVRIRRN